jgi:hypothetical protein
MPTDVSLLLGGCLARSSNLKMEAVCFVETSVNFIEMHSNTSPTTPLQEPQIHQDYELQVKWGHENN